MITKYKFTKKENDKKKIESPKKSDSKDFDLDKFFKETDKISEIIKKKEEEKNGNG